jgi:single-strand DNA-binding protein
MNKITIMGHLGNDPETRYTANGKKVTNFRIATNYRANGEDITIWYRVAVWGDAFDNLLPYLKKGSALIVSGDLSKPDIWTDQNGNNHVSMEIRANSLEFPRIGKGAQQENTAPAYQNSKPQSQSNDKVSPFDQQPQYGQGQENFDESNHEPIPF